MSPLQAIPRALGALYGSGQPAVGTSAGYQDGLGFSFPLTVGVATIKSDPIYVHSLTSFNLFVTIAVATINQSLSIDLIILRPDLTEWPAVNITAISTSVTGVAQVNFGSVGHDTNSSFFILNFTAFAYKIGLHMDASTVQLSDVSLAAGERM